MTLEESREVIPMMESMINQIEEQQNLMAEMVRELQEKDRQLLSFQEQNQSLQILNSELSGLLNLLPDTEELLSQIEQQKNCILPSRYNRAYSSGSSIASVFNAQSDPGVVFKFFSASQQSMRSI